MSMKYSRQRELILDNLCSRTDHPTADELYIDLKAIMPNLSLGTLYRNLALLSENGTILKFHCGTSDRFDGNSSLHYHLICEKCNRLYDLHHSPLNDLNSIFSNDYKGIINSHLLVFYGVCENCNCSVN